MVWVTVSACVPMSVAGGLDGKDANNGSPCLSHDMNEYVVWELLGFMVPRNVALVVVILVGWSTATVGFRDKIAKVEIGPIVNGV